ncbi:hypothetical protein ACUXIC_000901 [Enterococcus lactis]
MGYSDSYWFDRGGVILGLIQKKRVTDKDKKMDNKATNRTVIEEGRAGGLS